MPVPDEGTTDTGDDDADTGVTGDADVDDDTTDTGPDTTDTGPDTTDTGPDTTDTGPDTTDTDTGTDTGTTGTDTGPDTGDGPCQEDEDCFEGDPCTIDKCFNEQCFHSPVPGCESCTLDAEADVTQSECGGANSCNIASCAETTPGPGAEEEKGQCEYTAKTCFDGNPCTADDCADDTGCVFTWLDPLQCSLCGQKYGPTAADPEAPTAPQTPGEADTHCDSLFNCNTGACDYLNNKCIFTPGDFDDQDDCTVDFCDETDGVQHVLLNDGLDCGPCFDNDDPEAVCAKDNTVSCVFTSCNNVSGKCEKDLKQLCDDENSCTLDYCDTDTGECIHQTNYDLVGCDEEPPPKKCNPNLGDCEDDNLCTIDFCDTSVLPPPDPDGTEWAGICVNQLLDCGGGANQCEEGSCDADPTSISYGKCIYAAKNCDDEDPCTDDSCNKFAGCEHSDKNCDDKNDSTFDYCDQDPDSPSYGQCVIVPLDCDDKDECTKDVLVIPDEGDPYCVSTQIDCADGNPCTEDDCTALDGCTYKFQVCNDGDQCTTDN